MSDKLAPFRDHEAITHTMLEYLFYDESIDDIGETPNDVGYTLADITSVTEELDAYIDALGEADENEGKIRTAIEVAVLALNDVNESCGYALIETIERENIVEFMTDAAVAAGLAIEEGEDITEDFREW